MKPFKQILFVFFVVSSTSLKAQDETIIVTANGGWALMNVEDNGTSNSTGGYELGIATELLFSNKKFTLGIAYSYYNFKGEYVDRTGIYKTGVFTFQSKYFFNPESKTQVFLQGNLGLNSAHVEYIGPEISIKDLDYGMALGGGLGISKSLSERMSVNAAYNIKWLQNSYYKNGLVHSFLVGLAIRF